MPLTSKDKIATRQTAPNVKIRFFRGVKRGNNEKLMGIYERDVYCDDQDDILPTSFVAMLPLYSDKTETTIN